MLDVQPLQVIDCLRSLGIRDGDGLLIHSAVQYLGRPIGGLQMYLDAIQSVIGEQGTIAVPVFNFGFARGEQYDPRETPSQGMGAFSEFVRLQPDSLRTPHPMQSLAVLGHYAPDLAGRDTCSAFDPGSAFERMYELDFKLLLLGADERSISMFHYAEQRLKVPYRYWKEFTGEYRTPSGWEQRSYKMFVRNLELDPQLALKPVVSIMIAANTWHSVDLNYGSIMTCRLRDFIEAAEQVLSEDPWQLVMNRDRFVQPGSKRD